MLNVNDRFEQEITASGIAESLVLSKARNLQAWASVLEMALQHRELRGAEGALASGGEASLHLAWPLLSSLSLRNSHNLSMLRQALGPLASLHAWGAGRSKVEKET